MSITPFLSGQEFDQESRRVLSAALEMVCIALRTGDCDDDVRNAIAAKIIDLAKAGERNPDILCEESIERHSPAPTVGGLTSRAVFGTKGFHTRTEGGGFVRAP
jgi:hypothetical protein